jgi:hypothetical protein
LRVLRRWERQGEIDTRRARHALDDLGELAILRYPARMLTDRVWRLRRNLTAYDAQYVALAQELHATLATTDERLAAAPAAARVPLWACQTAGASHGGRRATGTPSREPGVGATVSFSLTPEICNPQQDYACFAQAVRASGASYKRLKGVEPSTFCMANGTASDTASSFWLQIAGISVFRR